MQPALQILVADDDDELLRTVCEGLERAGARVTRAGTGAELIELLAAHGPFDLVITDVSMPWMTGLHVMHSVRHAGLSTPVLVITALKDSAIDERVRALGEKAALLRKPFGLDELEAAVNRLAPRVLDGHPAP